MARNWVRWHKGTGVGDAGVTMPGEVSPGPQPTTAMIRSYRDLEVWKRSLDHHTGILRHVKAAARRAVWSYRANTSGIGVGELQRR